MVTGGKEGGVNWETGIGTYTFLSVKQITNRDLLWSTGDSAQYSVMAHVGKESENTESGCVCMCRADSLCCAPEVHTTLHISCVRVNSRRRVRLSVAPWKVVSQFLHPQGFPGKNTGVGCHFLNQLYSNTA